MLLYPVALAEVRQRVKAARSSFGMGLMFAPREGREAAAALYAFCRAVDDVVDEGGSLAERHEGLALWRGRIARLFASGVPEDPVTCVLAPAIARFALEEADFQAILDGMAMDAEERPLQAPDHATLDLYCDRVASAVGRIALRLFGVGAGPEQRLLAHHLGRAFQLTNILRDLTEDAALGRLYVPREALVRHGVVAQTPDAILQDPGFTAACRDVMAAATEHFACADALIRKGPRGALFPVRIMRAFYGAVAERLNTAEQFPTPQRIRLSIVTKIKALIQAL